MDRNDADRIGRGAVYLDTSVIAAAILPGAANHDIAVTFCADIATDQMPVVISDLVSLELLQALVAIANDSSQLHASMRRRFRLHRWGDAPDVRRNWLRHGWAQYDALRASFAEVIEVGILPEQVPAVIDLMGRWKLKSNDACHLVTAISVGATSFASIDSDFERVTDASGRSVQILALR